MHKADFSEEDILEVHKVAERFKPNIQIAVAKISGDSATYYGAKLDSNSTAHSIDNASSVFEIGSITKVLTSTLLAKLVTEGELSLDAPISDILGFNLNRGSTITLKELANHTSGLSRIPPGMFWDALFGSSENPYKDYNGAALERDLKSRIKLKKKGKSRYSNLGAGTLGYILGMAAGTSYPDLLIEQLLAPLGMTNTTANLQKVNGELVEGRGKNGKTVSNWEFDALAGAGAVLSTVTDLTKYVMANFDNADPIYKLQQTPTAKMNFMDHIGLGWMIQSGKLTNDRTWHWHDGGTGGYSSALVMDTDRKTGVIVLSNVSGLYFFKSQEITNLAFNLHKSMQQ